MEEVKKNNVFFVDDKFIHKRILVIEGKEYEFGFKELSGFDIDTINKSAVKIDRETREITPRPEIANLTKIMKCLISAPFEIKEENIKKLKDGIQKKLLKIIEEINKVEEKTIKN